MDQNTRDWLDWRSNGLGSSDAPIIMGVSPWCTPFRLWELKTGRREPEGENYATLRGHRVEPVARAHYELYTGIAMPARLAVHKDVEWLRASLDGYSDEYKIILEIKCPGRADHDMAIGGIVPPKYYPQLQHQLMVTGADRVDYFSFDGVMGGVVEVYPDLEYIRNYMEKAADFWFGVCNNIPPPFVDDDFIHVRKFAALKKRIAHWEWLLSEGDAEGAQKQISDIFADNEFKYERMRCGEFYIFRDEKRLVRRG